MSHTPPHSSSKHPREVKNHNPLTAKMKSTDSYGASQQVLLLTLIYMDHFASNSTYVLARERKMPYRHDLPRATEVTKTESSRGKRCQKFPMFICLWHVGTAAESSMVMSTLWTGNLYGVLGSLNRVSATDPHGYESDSRSPNQNGISYDCRAWLALYRDTAGMD